MKNNYNENQARTGLKFGYPDGYYRHQYPGLYSTPKSATAALDLEIEKTAPKESPNGMPRLKGMLSFKEWLRGRIGIESQFSLVDGMQRLVNRPL